MTAAIILFLCLVNILLIFSIIVLFARQNRLMDMEKRQQALLAETEESVIALLSEIKEENDRFLKQITQLKEKGEYSSKDEEHPPKNSPAQRNMPVQSLLETSSEQIKEPDETERLEEEQPLSRQVERLEALGMTVDDIAKALGKGKTEIRLARKFHQRA